MTWRAAMRWARSRALDTGRRHRVVGVRRLGGWSYLVVQADAWVDAWPGGCE